MDLSETRVLSRVDMSECVKTILEEMNSKGVQITPFTIISAGKAYAQRLSFTEDQKLQLIWWCVHTINAMRRESRRLSYTARDFPLSHRKVKASYGRIGKDAAANQGEDPE